MNKIQNHEQLLHDHQLRATATRNRLWEVISGFSGPFTAEEVLLKLANKKTTVHRATVFRDLEAFVATGILTELAVRGVKCRLFEKTSRVNSVHFACKECGRVSAHGSEELETAMKEESHKMKYQGYQVAAIGIKIYGRCPKCNRRKGS